MTFSKSFCDDYVNHFLKYTEEYGENVCILMQMGTFYEIQNVLKNDVYIGNLDKIANILNIHITSKKTKGSDIETTELPKVKFAGFPKIAITKFLPVLIDNGYTTVVIDEIKNGNKINRSVTGIYSSSIQPFDTITDNNLTSIFIETYTNKKEITVLYSIININTTINKCHIYDKNISGLTSDQIIENTLDDIYNIIIRYNSNEYIIYIKDNTGINLLKQDNIVDYLDIYNKNYHYKSVLQNEEFKLYQKPSYQNEFLKKVYNNINFGLIDPVEFFDLASCTISITNLLYTINFIAKHDAKYISNLAVPELITDYNHLILEMNTIKQLNIVSNVNNSKCKYDSLFSVVNKTTTAIGKRYLKNLLCKPLKNTNDIIEKYSFSEYIESLDLDKLKYLLSDICDFEKFHRKMSLQLINPMDFSKLHKTYTCILQLNNIVNNLDINILNSLNDYIAEYTSLFNIQELSKYTLQEISGNIFNNGVIQELDEIYNKICLLEKEIDNERELYENKLNGNGTWLKICNDQDGYYFSTTKLRARPLKDIPGIELKTNTNNTKIITKNLKKLSNDLLNNKEIFDKKIKIHYLLKILHLYSKYNHIFNKLNLFIANIDVAISNIQCKKIYNYCKPIVSNEINGNSFFEATEMRHPIIERINQDTSYVPNDVSLNDSENGIILYALNSCGKSSLLRSIGLNIILAQCGLYVPCKSLTFSPFNSIITQVDLQDNMWKSQSSFITEMIGLKKIIKIADKKCLVLADEISKGTENISASAILASSIIHLSNKNCRFVFTTHLHDIPKFDEIKNLKNLGIYNLSVIIDKENTITFERKLQKGPCSELYGLEVAKAVGLDNNLINTAFELRNILLHKKNNILSLSKSKYNSKKIVDSCEICGYTPIHKNDKPLHTHHIQFQCNSDSNGFNGHFYKNSKFNLVCLCDKCHSDVHLNKLNITGYIQTTNGIKLK